MKRRENGEGKTETGDGRAEDESNYAPQKTRDASK